MVVRANRSAGGTSPWSVLDPGPPAGRPDPERPGYRVLRGYIVAFASNATGDQIRWNHLGGSVVTVDYERTAASEVNAWSFPVVNPNIAHGAIAGTSGEIAIDGETYTSAPSQLLMNFMAVQSSAFSGPQSLVLGNTDLTLIPVDVDLRHTAEAPLVTKADITVWNENEVKLSGAYRCVSCWDQTLLSEYGIPNHFMPAALQTAFGKARIDGIASALCPGSVRRRARRGGGAFAFVRRCDAPRPDRVGPDRHGLRERDDALHSGRPAAGRWVRKVRSRDRVIRRAKVRFSPCPDPGDRSSMHFAGAPSQETRTGHGCRLASSGQE